MKIRGSMKRALAVVCLLVLVFQLLPGYTPGASINPMEAIAAADAAQQAAQEALQAAQGPMVQAAPAVVNDGATYSVAVSQAPITGTCDEGSYTVALSGDTINFAAKNLAKHTTAQNAENYWVGVRIDLTDAQGQPIDLTAQNINMEYDWSAASIREPAKGSGEWEWTAVSDKTDPSFFVAAFAGYTWLSVRWLNAADSTVLHQENYQLSFNVTPDLSTWGQPIINNMTAKYSTVSVDTADKSKIEFVDDQAGGTYLQPIDDSTSTLKLTSDIAKLLESIHNNGNASSIVYDGQSYTWLDSLTIASKWAYVDNADPQNPKTVTLVSKLVEKGVTNLPNVTKQTAGEDEGYYVLEDGMTVDNVPLSLSFKISPLSYCGAYGHNRVNGVCLNGCENNIDYGVTTATLHDVSGAVADGDLYAEGSYQVSLSESGMLSFAATDLVSHVAVNQVAAYWVGAVVTPSITLNAESAQIAAGKDSSAPATVADDAWGPVDGFDATTEAVTAYINAKSSGGAYTWMALRWLDGDGNVLNSQMFSLNFDGVTPKAPVVTLKAPTDTSYAKEGEDVELQFEVAMPGSDALTVLAYYGNDESKVLTTTEANGIYTVDLSALAEGSYVVTLKATTVAGEESATAVSKTIVLDNTAPSIANLTVAPEDWTNNAVTLSATVTDANLSSVYYSENGTLTDISAIKELAAMTASEQDQDSYSVSLPKTESGSTEGTNYYVYAVDDADNYSVSEAAVAKLDLTAPTVMLDTPDADYVDEANNKNWYSDNVTFGIQIDDNLSGVKKVNITPTINGSDAKDRLTDTETADKYALATDVVLPGEGEQGYEYVLKVGAADNADNDADPKQSTVYVDKTDPTVDAFQVDYNEGNSALNMLTFGWFFNDTVTVRVSASDGNGSGVKQVELKVVASTTPDSDGSATETYTAAQADENGLYCFTLPAADSGFALKEDGSLVIDCELSAKATDNVGNTPDDYTSAKGDLTLEIVKPTVKVEIQAAPTVAAYTDTEAKKQWFSGDVVFAVSVTDEHSGIASIQVKVNDEAVEDASTFSQNFAAMDKLTDSYTFDIETKGLKEKDSYELAITVTDNAGNEQTSILVVDANDQIMTDYSPVAYIDTTAPEITGMTFPEGTYVADAQATEVSSFADDTDAYGIYLSTEDEIEVTIHAAEVAESHASGVKSITYYTQSIDSKGDLESQTDEVDVEVDESTDSITVTIGKGFRGYLFAKATDKVDNESAAVHPDALILEGKDTHNGPEDAPVPHIVIERAETDKKTADGGDLYDAAVPVTVYVVDTVSGIRNVNITVASLRAEKATYALTIPNEGAVAEGWTPLTEEKVKELLANEPSEELKELLETIPDNADRNLVFGIMKEITVANEDNNITVDVALSDRAGNTSSASDTFSIDTVKPVISVSYTGAAADTGHSTVHNGARVAIVTIKERNFDPNLVVFTITNNGGAVPSLNEWSYAPSPQNPDEDIYTMSLVFRSDGDYSLSVECTDRAGNAAESVRGAGFTVDSTVPTLTVVYDNTEALNENYYKAPRIATITVREHNFDANRVTITGSAVDDGTPVNFPALTRWTSRGDTHTATLSYDADAFYGFDIDVRDQAGNRIADYSKDEFYVDQTAPVLKLTGLVEESANGSSEDIGFVLTATDTNFDIFEPSLTAVMYNGQIWENVDLTDLGKFEDIENGQTYTITNLPDDGIYSLNCRLIDKAGNEYETIVLLDDKGEEYEKERPAANSREDLFTFSVNRHGSTFTLNDYAAQTVMQYYVQNITDIMGIIEVNADPLASYTVTVNGEAVEEGKDFTVTTEGGKGAWMKYLYEMNSELFADEGEYRVVVESVDKAGHSAFSDVESAAMNFVVDRTAPVVTVSGLADNGRYHVEKQTVTLIPTDDGGALSSILVLLVDDEGQTIQELMNLSGKDLADALEAGGGLLQFEIGEGLYQNVQIICRDCAVDAAGNTNTFTQLFEDISVSQSGVMIFWANRALRWSCIAGLILVVALIIIIPVAKKKSGKKTAAGAKK